MVSYRIPKVKDFPYPFSLPILPEIIVLSLLQYFLLTSLSNVNTLQATLLYLYLHEQFAPPEILSKAFPSFASIFYNIQLNLQFLSVYYPHSAHNKPDMEKIIPFFYYKIILILLIKIKNFLCIFSQFKKYNVFQNPPQIFGSNSSRQS